jgi:hypothetical protein
MPRYAVPVLAVLALAGCGGGARTGTAAAAPAPIPQPAPTAPVAKAEPAPAPVRKHKKGEAEPAVVQPDGPALPADFGSGTTRDQLAAHALIVAREEVAAGLAGTASVLQRRDFLVALWTPQLQARQQVEGAIRAARERDGQREAGEAGRLAGREAELRAMEADYDHRLEVERRRTAPIESE